MPSYVTLLTMNIMFDTKEGTSLSCKLSCWAQYPSFKLRIVSACEEWLGDSSECSMRLTAIKWKPCNKNGLTVVSDEHRDNKRWQDKQTQTSEQGMGGG